MKLLHFAHCRASRSLALLLLVGCAGLQQPFAQPGAVQPTPPKPAPAEAAASWVVPEAKGDDLLYVATTVAAKSNRVHILIFAYPQGKLVGELLGFYAPVYGLCTDKSGNVFVADLNGEDVREYAHGGDKPILTLNTHGSPDGCAVDPISGDLVVPEFCDGPSGSCFNEGTVLIYGNARRRPKKLTDPNISTPFYCTFDKAGNLYLNGLAGAFYTDTYDELPAGGHTFVNLTLDKVPEGQQPGDIQWHRGNLAVGPSAAGNVIYEYRISGTTGTKVGETKLGGVPPHNGVEGFWVQGKTLVAPEWNIQAQHGIGKVQFFRYPSGGKPIATINHVFYFPTAAVVSLALRKH